MAVDPLTPFIASGENATAKSPKREIPAWMLVAAIFVASRVVTTTLMLWFAARQPANAWTGRSPGYFDFASMWDGNWYFIAAMAGYPTELPLTEEGEVSENAWAFMPAYPFLVRALMLLTGAPFEVVAVLVSVGFALAAAIMFHKLMALFLDRGQALFAVVLFCVAPLSPVLQVAYAESMHAFLLTTALYLLVKRDYGWLFPVVGLMALTRPSGLAFALAVGLHVVYRFVKDPSFGWRERVTSMAVAIFSAIAGFSWLLIAWVRTGSFTAYTDTELAWRSAYVGYGELVPFTPWLQGAEFWVGQPGGPVIVALAVLTIAGIVALLLLPASRRMGVDVRLWVASYMLYLLAVFFPQSSTFRLLLPIFPLWGVVALPRSNVYRAVIVALCIAGQWGWIHIAWWVDGYDWTPP